MNAVMYVMTVLVALAYGSACVYVIRHKRQ